MQILNPIFKPKKGDDRFTFKINMNKRKEAKGGGGLLHTFTKEIHLMENVWLLSKD